MLNLSDERLVRKRLKGTSKDDDKLRLLCQIRHEFTNYDKLVVFYNVFPTRRKELNAEIGKLINIGPEYIEQFRKKVKHIEEVVNLNNKEAKKKFLRKEEHRLRTDNPMCMEKRIKEWALTNLNIVIRANNNNISTRRSIKNGN